MKCPECGLIDNSKVTDSRNIKTIIKRSRKCKGCQNKWKTYEINEEQYNYAIRDKTQRRGWTCTESKNLIKFRIEGLSYDTIGEKLGRTPGSVKTHLYGLLETGDYFYYMEELEAEKVGG